MQSTGPDVHFLNIEYFFRLIYEALTTFHISGGTSNLNLIGIATTIWIIACIIAFAVCAAALFVLMQATTRMFQIKAEDAPKYTTIHDAHHAEEERDHSRWNHVMNLIESPSENDWRQAIIEADIMLDDLLSQLGYPGASVGEKLRAVDPARFATLQEAWEAHKVRNEIAHQGSSYPLTDQMAYRTIKHYENIMREHGEIQ
ncbi:MAG: protein of unknown function with transrane region [Parcubacteria group bacterium]|nr:protein of unknown function with transrane region [Parcubacteria group bacterium]